MAGRLPFDAGQGHQNSGLTPQMRAALGLPTIEELFLGQQRAHHEAQRDLQYRRALYQDQLDQQLQELQLRANFAHIDDLSDFRRSLLLSEHQRRTEHEQALLRHALARQSSAGAATTSSAPSAGSVNLHQAVAEAQAAQLRYREQIKRQQEQDQAKRRQEELMLLQQVRQAMQEQQSGAAAVAVQQRVLPVPTTASIQQSSLPPSSPQMVSQAVLNRAESMDGESVGRGRSISVTEVPEHRVKKKSRANNFTPQAMPPPAALKPPPDHGLATLEDMADAVVREAIPRYGTVQNLLEAAASENKAFEIANVLTSLKSVEWLDSDDEESQVGADVNALPVPKEPAESVVLPYFHSFFPALPSEPMYEEKNEQNEQNVEVEAEGTMETDGAEGKQKEEDMDVTEMVSNVLQYPYPVDTWYPSMNSRKRERRQAGETSNEEEFDHDKDLFVQTKLRAHPKKIIESLKTQIEPGVLEKLPHCRLHRIRTKYTTVAELLFCFQVTDSYPNDIMVNCSRCGTWRHAACGGHYKPVSRRECASEAFVALCENCHGEESYLKDYPRGKHFLDRQRIEHLRRGLCSTAVMRQMSFMKHGGTYKWPMGSVSATHVGGHIRSVQGRHDKTEKQWGDLAARLSRRFGYRSKERARTRTKELERLLVCVEDAEGLTDRHNMVLFLDRDIRRVHPVGFEKTRRNIFDPEDFHRPQIVEDESSSTESASNCARPGCIAKHRFDSIFCSDACGVATLEKDLLKAFHEASDIHPSVLRFSY